MSKLEFQVVKSKKKTRKFNKVASVQGKNQEEVDVERVLKKIDEIKLELNVSDILRDTVKKLKEAIENKLISEVICLGIGRVSDCIIAKHQLALLLMIHEELKIESRPKFYDPIISKYDIEILTKLNCVVLEDNKEGRYSVDKITLFYLPHCPKQITNNLLYSNWSAESLKNIILICNSFSKIITSTPERILRPNANYLLDISKYTSEVEIDNSYKFSDIFNDFSIHTFAEGKLESVPAEFWSSRLEPVYSSEDLEFIKNVSD